MAARQLRARRLGGWGGAGGARRGGLRGARLRRSRDVTDSWQSAQLRASAGLAPHRLPRWRPTPSSAPVTKSMFGRGNVCRSSASQPSAGGVAAAEHSAAASERGQGEVKVIGAAPARTKSSHEEALATEQRRGARADDSAAALASAPWNKKRLEAKRSRSSARRQRRPSLATKRRLLQSSAETNARGRSHQRWRLQQNCSGMLD